MDTKTITISHRQLRALRYYAGTILDDKTKLSDDSAIALDNLCEVINNINKNNYTITLEKITLDK